MTGPKGMGHAGLWAICPTFSQANEVVSHGTAPCLCLSAAETAASLLLTSATNFGAPCGSRPAGRLDALPNLSNGPLIGDGCQAADPISWSIFAPLAILLLGWSPSAPAIANV